VTAVHGMVTAVTTVTAAQPAPRPPFTIRERAAERRPAAARLSPMRDRERAKDWVRRAACLVAAGVGGYYIVWRLLFTLNTHALWFAIPLWIAEAFGLVSTLLFFYTVWDTRSRRPAPPPREGLKVDIFIPTYNEPMWMVRRTILGALDVRYPHETYLLDDGRRPEAEALARELGCHYITRPTNEGAKAGNLNHAMLQTSGDLIAIFDTDHVPMPEFLDRTLGYFEDERLAFVQSPQEYYNVDSFQHRTDRRNRRSWHEQSLFYRVIQPGKDRWNAAFFCGSCGVMRRQALEDVGGFATETITEDMHTAMRMHARGWRSAYHSEVLALGLAAQTATPYHVQRLRWGQGTMQVMRREGPFGSRGLSIHQHINYLASALHYLDGFQRIVLYMAPPLCVATGVLPIRGASLGFLLRLIAYYGTSMLAFKLAARGYGMFLQTERFHMIRFFTYIRACTGLVARRKLRFKVSDKAAPGGADRGTLLPIAVVAAYVALCLVGGIARLALGRDDNAPAFWINVFWTGWAAYLVTVAVLATVRTTDIRQTPRAHAGLPLRWASGGHVGVGVLADLSERGAAVLLPRGVTPGGTVTFHVEWPGQHISAKGEVRRRTDVEQGILLGLEWPEAHGAEAVRLARMAAQLTARHYMLTFDRPWDRFGLLELRRGHRRRAPRRTVNIPVHLGEGAEGCWGVTEDVSSGGALVLSARPFAVGTTVGLRPWNGEEVEAEVVRCEALRRPPGESWRLGLRLAGPLDVVASDAVEAPVGAGSAA
jgi:cellulose synthase (UDP-forming)